MDSAKVECNFEIKPSQLLPGDVLLHRAGKNKPQTNVVSKLTSSPYTHASIYVGNNFIAEAVLPKIRRQNLSNVLKKCEYIGVLRSQVGFLEERKNILTDFIDQLIKNNAKYDLTGAIKFSNDRADHFQNEIERISENYGSVTSKEEFEKRKYFCSALIVASYSVVGIIGESAQVAYPPGIFSPGDLYKDVTFGWFLGYLKKKDVKIQDDDPLMNHTLWCDQQELRWW